MNILSWLPFGKKTEPAGEDTLAQRAKRSGPVTGCDLSQVECLVRPFAQDPFYRLRPPFSKEAAELSLELADMSYTLELDPWRAAGWNDFSILIDDSLQSGLTHWESGDALSAIANRVKLLRAKAALKEPNPISQLTGALRQRERSDTVKAVCMLHPLEGGRFLLAVGFMGTGSRFYDWISNFRFTPEEGFHRGFYQLCDSFEQNAESIVFPAAAEALGLEKLTLGEIFSEMKSLSSRFRLWMAGHSQGAAVMQVLAHRLITDWGVLPQNITGYGFASPTVATGRFVYDPAAYPLYHILSADDPVCRMGALLHLGLCLEYQPDDSFREQIYRLGTSQEEEALRSSMAFFQSGLQDMPSALVHMTALLQCLAEEKGADGLSELMSSWWAIGAVDKVLWRAGDRAMEFISRLMEGANEAHLALTGQLLDPSAVQAVLAKLRPIVQTTSVRRLLSLLADFGVSPHRLTNGGADEGQGAYAAIVGEKLQELHPFIWIKASKGLPVRRYADWFQQEHPSAMRIRRERPSPALRGKMRVSHLA